MYKTNYRKRLCMLKSKMPRLAVRKSLSKISASIIEYAPDGDKVMLTVTTNHLEKYGYTHSKKNVPSAYLLGLLTAMTAKKRKITKLILDIGRQQKIKGSRAFAVLKGSIDGGLDIKCKESIFPSEERILGKHIAEFAKSDKIKNNQFSKSDASKITDDFNKARENILKEFKNE